MKHKYYNPETEEKFQEAKIIRGNPSGIVCASKEPFTWATNIYRVMQSYTWYVSECNVSQDKIPYKKLIPEHKYAYDMALGQLITNDSIQTKQLVDSVCTHITAPGVIGCLTRQAYEEFEHAITYTAIAEEVCEDVERIYNLHKHEPMLARKNEAVAVMYDKVNSNDNTNPTDEDLTLAFVANQILEQLVFPGGFIVLWSFGFAGTDKAIQFIERDETGTHVPLFKNIYRTTIKQVGLKDETKEKIIDLIKFMTEEEKIWTKHISRDLMGFSETTVDIYIENCANLICKNLKLEPIYTVTDGGPLYKLYNAKSLLGNKAVKTNFFEKAVGDYAVNTLDDDY